MDKTTFETADTFIDQIAEVADDVLDCSELAHLRDLLVEMNKALGSRYSVSLTLNVDVFDNEKERDLPLLLTGLSGFDKGKPYHTWGDSTPHKYILDGDMQMLPHDRCPKCWEVWDFKFKHRTCGHCGATLGQDVKLLLDNDTCPYCEEGRVSVSNPVCDKCGYQVDLKEVVWG